MRIEHELSQKRKMSLQSCKHSFPVMFPDFVIAAVVASVSA